MAPRGSKKGPRRGPDQTFRTPRSQGPSRGPKRSHWGAAIAARINHAVAAAPRTKAHANLREPSR
eukprot:6316444-Pyramimonas_sp.AAC.1